MRVTLHSPGIEAVLKSAKVAEAVKGLADHVVSEALASEAYSSRGVEVHAETYETDRAAARVIVKDVRAMPLEAKYGVLTKAARKAGLKVRGRRSK